MLIKLFVFALFIIAEIGLGIYSLLLSESLLARFFFFILSAIIVCIVVIKFGHKLLPFEENEQPQQQN
ncbi:hypothetical protein ACFFGL_07260 [Mesonia maritima]|jgi:uncharacterized membrane protein YjjP (DUF1212 family)|uniref:Uncharacterized membrane protein YjjP (DUF1212 family) n=1 Tax=Mesonia maritima TaxID=1793873 RepID=A0ABU1K3F0_9FLAO|nr:uncharacterized membrane protein YjjP (DUF1212 family) [Mesonia maritima]